MGFDDIHRCCGSGCDQACDHTGTQVEPKVFTHACGFPDHLLDFIICRTLRCCQHCSSSLHKPVEAVFNGLSQVSRPGSINLQQTCVLYRAPTHPNKCCESDQEGSVLSSLLRLIQLIQERQQLEQHRAALCFQLQIALLKVFAQIILSRHALCKGYMGWGLKGCLGRRKLWMHTHMHTVDAFEPSVGVAVARI